MNLLRKILARIRECFHPAVVDKDPAVVDWPSPREELQRRLTGRRPGGRS